MRRMPLKGKLMTEEEVAKTLDIDAQTVRSRSFRKRIGLKGIKLGSIWRFRREEVNRFTDLVTDFEVAEFLNVPIQTMRSKYFLDRIGLETVWFGKTTRFRREEIEDFIDRNTESTENVA